VDTVGKKVLVGISFGYLGIVLFLPALNVFYQAFRNGVGPFLYHLTDPDFLQAVGGFSVLLLIMVLQSVGSHRCLMRKLSLLVQLSCNLEAYPVLHLRPLAQYHPRIYLQGLHIISYALLR
jgi:hypothetical protein